MNLPVSLHVVGPLITPKLFTRILHTYQKVSL